MRSLIKYFFSLFLLTSVLFSCKKEFELDFSLATNQVLVELDTAAGETNFMVYSKTAWKAELEKDINWAQLEDASGKSNGAFKFKYTRNTGGARSVFVKLTSGSLTKRVEFIQAEGLKPTFYFIESQPVIVAKAYPVVLPLITNLGTVSDLDNITTTITYSEESTEEWIKDYQITEEGFVINVLSNTSGNDRRALIKLVHKDGYGKETIAECDLRQTAESAIFTLEEDNNLYMMFEASSKIPYQTNMKFSMKALQTQVVYESGFDWIQDVVIDSAGGFNFKVQKNETGLQRIADIKIKALALDGSEDILGVFRVTQTATTHQVLSFEDLRGLISGSSGELLLTNPNHAIDGVVISDRSNVNMALNPLVAGSWSQIDWSVSEKTAYIQSADAQLGLCIQTASVDDNIFERSQGVRLLLKGMTLVKESNPTRYTLRNATANHVLSSSTAVIPSKQKTISALTDRDLYTYTTVTNVEFTIKNGAYTNVHDGYTVTGGGNAAGTVNGLGIDCVPRKVNNSVGETLNILFNMKLPWRRLQNNDLPKGSGNISGVLVHEKMLRHGKDGDIGRYQIRPLVEADIALGKTESNSLTSTLVEWNWDDNKNVTTLATVSKPEIAFGNNANASFKHESFTQILRVPDYNSSYAYNKSKGGDDIEGYLNYGAIQYRGLFWNYDEGKGRGFIVDFSTTNINSQAYLMFTIAGGHGASGISNYFPTNWHVEYSIADGPYSKISGSDFIVRHIGWSALVPIYATMSLNEHCIKLPTAILNQSKVVLKIVPSSNIGLTRVNGSDNLDAFQPYFGAVSSTEISRIRFGTVSVKYNK